MREAASTKVANRSCQCKGRGLHGSAHWMRHSELRTTQNIYIKSDEEKAREGINKLDESFRSRKVVSIKKTA